MYVCTYIRMYICIYVKHVCLFPKQCVHSGVLMCALHYCLGSSFSGLGSCGMRWFRGLGIYGNYRGRTSVAWQAAENQGKTPVVLNAYTLAVVRNVFYYDARRRTKTRRYYSLYGNGKSLHVLCTWSPSFFLHCLTCRLFRHTSLYNLQHAIS